ncbi:MAG: hypothetical protein AB8H80_14005 [Planctomycetota bacterium]
MKHLLRSGLLAGVACSTLLFSGAAAAQGPAVGPPGSGASQMLATGGYLFVLRGGSLYQFDVVTLKLLNQHRFEAGGTGDADAFGAAIQRAIRLAPDDSSRAAAGKRAPQLARAAAMPPVAPVSMAVAVECGLDWLARHQDEDGRWDCDNFMKHDKGTPSDGAGNPVHDVGVTALATLAFLGHGNTMDAGPHKEVVARGVKWLRAQQQENGLIGSNASHDFIYDHALAAFALAETCNLSGVESTSRRIIKSTAQRAINYLESHRNPYAVWRYMPRDNDNDTSVTTWAVLALRSAKDAGLEVNGTALEMARVWFDQVTDEETGRIGYCKAGESSSRKPGDHAKQFPVGNCETLTAAGTFARLALGEKPDESAMAKAGALLRAKPPQWRPGHIDAVYWFFGGLASYQLGGETWQAWQPGLAQLAVHQRDGGSAQGSWDTDGVWDNDGGRVFVTALNTLSLATVLRANRLVR